jgi:hypothetical protein
LIIDLVVFKLGLGTVCGGSFQIATLIVGLICDDAVRGGDIAANKAAKLSFYLYLT